MIASAWMPWSCARKSLLFLILSGWVTGRLNLRAACFTGDSINFMPRPFGRSSWVTTSLILNPADTSLSNVGTANIGVPQKTRSIMHVLPFALLHQLADLALHHVTLQRADVADVELAVEMIGFVQQSASQQVVARHFEKLTLQILRAGRDRACARHLFAKFGQAETALVRADTSLGMNDLRINQCNLGCRIFLEGHVDYRDPFADADLRGSQPYTVRGIHAFEHVFDELP